MHYLDTNKEINSSIAAKLLKVEIKTASRLSGWQENYMEGLVKEYANFLNDDKKPASEKFWELENG